MNRLVTLSRRIPAWVIDIVLVAVAAADAGLYSFSADPLTIGVCVVSCAALLVRRRWPLVAFALTLPAALVANVLAAPLIALFALAARTRKRWLLYLCGLLSAAAEAVGWPLTTQFTDNQNWTAVTFVYQAGVAAAPILLGQLVQITGDLRARIAELETTKRHERELYAQTALARERNQLAREMHDVVSHQVSLIAVQAGALQVTTTEAGTREAAASIRALSSTTLEELRNMVMLLRAAGTQSAGLAPQPTASDLETLIAGSGLPVTVTGHLPSDTNPSTQRAVYRTVQEALTNVRKHAPGSTISVTLWAADSRCGVSVINGRATEPPLHLPSARLGLLGLRERAELLGGHLHAAPTDEGFRVDLSVPRAHA